MRVYNQRFLLSIGIIIFCLLSVQAKPITQKEALQKAHAFMITDTDNKIVAVRSQSLKKTSGVSGIESRLYKTQGEIKSISYYDAAGRKFNAPVKGLNIVKVTYVNGTVKTMKVNN